MAAGLRACWCARATGPGEGVGGVTTHRGEGRGRVLAPVISQGPRCLSGLGCCFTWNSGWWVKGTGHFFCGEKSCSFETVDTRYGGGIDSSQGALTVNTVDGGLMFGKLFESMYDGTLATKGPWQALVTFQQFIILSNRHGEVDMTAEAISRRTTIPVEIIKTGIAHLLEPDLDSRSPDENGRRLVPIDAARVWGWRIVNYDHYRKIRSAEERREYLRQAQADHRARLKGNQGSTTVNTSTDGQRSQPIAVSRSSKQKVGTSFPQSSTEGPVQERGVSSQQVPSEVPPRTTVHEGAADPQGVDPPVPILAWSRYHDAYLLRYAVEPVRNAKANALMQALARRLGKESPEVAAYYLTHNGQVYVRSKHALELLVRDCEGLRTEWKRGAQVTHTEARHADRTQATANAFGPLIAEARDKEGYVK